VADSAMAQVENGKTFAEVVLEKPKEKKIRIVKPGTIGSPIVMPKPKAKPEPEIPHLCQKDLLAILGTADTLHAAPFENEDFEIWGVAVVVTYEVCKRWDILFEMHTDGYWKDKNVLARLQATNAPIYMHEKYPEVPTSMRFPIELITKSYRPYHTTSITYMLALAYHSFVTTGKPSHVALFGVHMAAREEYTEQRPCCEYWLGRMEAAGMDVEPSPGGALLVSSGLYGYENYNPICYDFRQRIQGLQLGAQKSEQEQRKWLIQRAKNQGAIQEAEHWLRRFQRGEIK